MDTNTNNSTSSSSSWDLDMTMGNHHLLLDQPPFEFLHLLDPFHPSPPFPSHPQFTPIIPDPDRTDAAEDQLQQDQEDQETLGAMKEMMYKIAAMQPVDIDPSTIKKPKRRNVRISDDPQSIAARHRRERISERIRILQRLVPGGTKMDTASMLDEAIRYVKFLKRQVQELQANPPAPQMQLAVGPPVGVEWNPRHVIGSHNLGSSSGIGGPAGLGFGFAGDGPSDRMC